MVAITDLPVKKYKPFEHQDKMFREAHKNLNERGAHALFCEMGTGKTYVTLALIRKMSEEEGRPLKTLIVCPKSVVYSWTKDIEDHTWEKTHNLVGLSQRQRQLALDSALSQGGIAIINYDSLKHIEGVANEFDFVALDESSKIKNPKAQRTKKTKLLFARTAYKLILSGTPITNNVLDIFAQFAFLDTSLLGFKNYYSFRGRYCKMGGFKNYEVVGTQNMPELKEKIDRWSTQLKKEDCLDLPEKVYTTTYIDMSPAMRRQYKEMQSTLTLEYSQGEITAAQAVTKMLRLAQIQSGEFLSSQKDNEKLITLIDLVEEITEAGNQVVIWYHFKASREVIREMLLAKGHKLSEISGETDDRPEQIRQFQEGESKVFLASITAAGMGVTLNRGNYAIYYENNFKMEDRKQSEDRIHRIGQEKTCQYIDLCYTKSLDEKVLKAIQRKQDFATSLVDSFKKGQYLEVMS